MEYPQVKRAIEIFQKLRDPKDGCPWDLAQDHKSLLKYLVEESYEYIAAVESGKIEDMEDELGDVLLQVLLHAQIASESGHFDIESVAERLADKMVYRHPHIFSDVTADTPEEVLKNWRALKKKEKDAKQEDGKPKYHFSENDLAMPALLSAHRIGKRSQDVNFDWDTVEQVADKVQEEWDEVQHELKDIENNKDAIYEEIGDLLFSVTQLARHLKIDSEAALRDANKKFINRFNHMEDEMNAQGLDMMKLTVPELEDVWQTVKKKLKKK